MARRGEIPRELQVVTGDAGVLEVGEDVVIQRAAGLHVRRTVRGVRAAFTGGAVGTKCTHASSRHNASPQQVRPRQTRGTNNAKRA